MVQLFLTLILRNQIMTSNQENNQDQSLTDTLKELEEIVGWFDEQDSPDVEQGLQKVKQGVKLIKSSKDKFEALENEFTDIKEQLDEVE